MLPPLNEPVQVQPLGRIGLVTLILLVKQLAQFISRNRVKIRVWLSENTNADMVALFDQLVGAIDAFNSSIAILPEL